MPELADRCVLLEWVRSQKNEDRQFDVRERSAIREGNLRALRGSQLVGETVSAKWKPGQFYPAVVVTTGNVWKRSLSVQ